MGLHLLQNSKWILQEVPLRQDDSEKSPNPERVGTRESLDFKIKQKFVLGWGCIEGFLKSLKDIF